MRKHRSDYECARDIKLRNTSFFLTIATMVISASLLQGCLEQPIYERNLERAELRRWLHNELATNKVVNNRDSWNIISDGARLSDNKIQLFYRRVSIDRSHTASGNNQNEPDYWNREHIWPQSYGIRKTPAARDLHNIVPADRSVNTSRSNKIFDKSNSPHKECQQCRTSRDSWEPPDAAKGDVARILFYMDVRYEGSEEVPDLSLTDLPDKDKAKFGRLTTLLQWHCSDAVSNEEQWRNNVVALAQGNRNAFVDNPQLAEKIYDFDCRTARYTIAPDT